jgi:tight adherence protein B
MDWGSTFGMWGVALLFAICFGGLAYSFLSAMREAMNSYGEVYAEDTARQFEDLFLFISPRKLVEIARVTAIATFLIFFLVFGGFESARDLVAGFFFGLVGAAIALQAPKLILAYLKAKRLNKFNEQLVDALTRMSNSLKAGFSILQAFESIVKENMNPIAQEFGVFMHQVRVGVRFEEALASMEKRIGSEDLTLTVRAIEIARMTGGNLTDVLEKIASTIRERMRIQGRIRALTAQGRLQGIVAGAMPVLLLFAMALIDPKMVNTFVTSVGGLIALGIVALLILCGALVIRKIIRIEV